MRGAGAALPELPPLSEVEVVVPTIRSLDNLAAWRDVLRGVRIIVIQDGEPDRRLPIPEGLNCSVFSRRDIDHLLGNRSWIISRLDSACRCFGFLATTARYVYTLDDDCTPPLGLGSPLGGHLANLTTASWPDYFNTLYDIEFVRGFPHSLRQGRKTAISRGLWLNHPDLDAITQMARPELRIVETLPIVQTVPRGVQYSMCGMNLAFQRELIGPAMYFGLMGEGQPWGRYDDLWAGWCSKAICDHLGFGVKTGQPYIDHQKASNWQRNLAREANGLRWAGALYRFFEEVRFDRASTTASQCYLELADQVEEQLSGLDAYFAQLAEAMRIWIEVWNELAEERLYPQTPVGLTSK